MKRNHFKFACVVLAFVVVALCPTMVYAVQEEYTTHHVHSENCVYSCEQDHLISETSTSFVSSRTHIDHPGSENCIYSCDYAMNHYTGAGTGNQSASMSAAESIAKLQENPSDEALCELVSSWYNIPFDTTDLEEMGALARSLPRPTAEEVDRILADYYAELERSGYMVEDSENSTMATNEQPSAAFFCEHHFITLPCENDHCGGSGCSVWCIRVFTCEHCHVSYTSSIQETNHVWSEGWCGQACRTCGLVDLFHQPGGCWYCK